MTCTRQQRCVMQQQPHPASCRHAAHIAQTHVSNLQCSTCTSSCAPAVPVRQHVDGVRGARLLQQLQPLPDGGGGAAGPAGRRERGVAADARRGAHHRAADGAAAGDGQSDRLRVRPLLRSSVISPSFFSPPFFSPHPMRGRHMRTVCRSLRWHSMAAAYVCCRFCIEALVTPISTRASAQAWPSADAVWLRVLRRYVEYVSEDSSSICVADHSRGEILKTTVKR